MICLSKYLSFVRHLFNKYKVTKKAKMKIY